MPVTAKAPMRVAPATLCMHVAQHGFCALHSSVANLTKRRFGHVIRQDAVYMNVRVKT